MSNKAQKRGLVPKLRFPEFQEAGEWEARTLGSLLDYQQPTAYLVSDTNYSDTYKTPVLTAGKTFILGYTNEQHGIFSENLPVIIFDDFTTATQFVDFPFKAKSSAMKILQAKNGVNIQFVYEAMQMISYEVGTHERHWISTFAPMSILAPKPKEQKIIADCLASLDERITLEAQKLDTLKTHKKGLMQQLFPAEGETLPKLRFPEFRDADGWVIKRLCEVADVNASGDLDSENFSPTKTEDHIYPIYSNSVTQEGLYGYCTYPKFKKNSVTITARGTLGVAFYRDHDYVGIGRLLVLSNLNNIVPCYLREVWNYSAKMPLENGGIPQLTAIKARAVELWMPGKEEQQKIADCLCSLDDLITAQTQNITVLKTHKKGLMQQLFPVLDEVAA